MPQRGGGKRKNMKTQISSKNSTLRKKLDEIQDECLNQNSYQTQEMFHSADQEAAFLDGVLEIRDDKIYTAFDQVQSSFTDKGWMPDSVNPTINECDEQLEKSRNWQDQPLEDIVSEEMSQQMEYKNKPLDKVDIQVMNFEDNENDQDIEFEKFSKKESMRSLSENNLIIGESSRSQENASMNIIKIESAKNNQSQIKQSQYRSKSKGNPRQVQALPRHQIIYNKAKQKANQDLIDLGCMKTIEEIKAEKAMEKVAQQKAKKTPIEKKREVINKKEVQSSIYLGKQSKEILLQQQKQQEKIREQMSFKFPVPKAPLKRQVFMMKQSSESREKSGNHKIFADKKNSISEYIASKSTPEQNLKPKFDEFHEQTQNNEVSKIEKTEEKIQESGEHTVESSLPVRNEILSNQDIQELNEDYNILPIVHSPKSKTMGGFGFSQNSGSDQQQIRRIDSANKENSKTPKRRLNSITKNRDEGTSPSTVKKQTSQTIRDKNQYVSGNPIVCQTLSVEPYIRRAVQRAGWIENLIRGYRVFHVKFDVSDIDVKVEPNQYYNHFSDNRELCTKGGLTKNLWTQCSYETTLQITNFFPRSYDLSDTKQADNFISDFQQTAILSIFNKYATISMEDQTVNDLVKEYKRRKQFEKPYIFIKNFKKKCSSIDQLKKTQKSEYLDMSSQFAKYLISLTKIKENTKCIKQKKFIPMSNRISDENVNKLLEAHSKMIYNKFKEVQISMLGTIDKVNCVILHQKLCKLMPQYKCIDGNQNVWVVKPTYSSRGRGIYCTNQLKEIIQSGKKTQSKVVQKYIESPYLLRNKKFDLRQWVLVTSWDPLDVYVFDNAYLKLCSSSFSLNDLSDVYVHLSSYSIQKKGTEYNEPDDLVKSTKDFEIEMGNGFSWERDMLPKIKDIVYRTFKGCQDSQTTDNQNKRFEIYGVDLILDQQLDPWVIEINLSPACSERVPWLTKMLDDMAFDLITWLERKILLAQSLEDARQMTEVLQKKRVAYWKVKESFDSLTTLNNEQFYIDNDIQYKWLRLEQSFEEIRQFEISQQYIGDAQVSNQLELVGYKADGKQEKKLDKTYWKYESAAIITRAWKGYKGRMIARHIRQTRAAIIIQKYNRMHLAILEKKQLKRVKCAIQIQCCIRKAIAIRELNYRIAVKIHLAKCKVANRIACHFKRRNAQALLSNLKLQDKARRIQKYLRGLLSWRMSKYTLAYKCKILFIQKFYKRRMKVCRKNAILLQKYIKGRKTWLKAKRLGEISKASFSMNTLIERRRKNQSLLQLKKDALVTRIQCIQRQMQAKQKLKYLKVNFAQNQVKQIGLKLLVKIEALNTFKSLIHFMHERAKTIQAQIRKYALNQKLRALQFRLMQEKQANIIQRYMRGQTIYKEYQKRLKQRRKDAATKLQTWHRKLVCRRPFLIRYAAILEQKRVSQLKVQSRTSEKVVKQTGDEIYKLLSNTKIANPELKGPKKFVSKSKEKQAKFGKEKKQLEMPKLPSNPMKSKRWIEKEMNNQEKQIKQLEDAFYNNVRTLNKNEKNSKSSLSIVHRTSPELKEKMKNSNKIKQYRLGLSSENIRMEQFSQVEKRKKILKIPPNGETSELKEQSTDTTKGGNFSENLKNLLALQRTDNPHIENLDNGVKKVMYIAKDQTSKIGSTRAGPIRATAIINHDDHIDTRSDQIYSDMDNTPSPSIRFIKKQPSQLSLNAQQAKKQLLQTQDQIISSRNYQRSINKESRMFPELIQKKNSKSDLQNIEGRPVKDPRTEALVNISMKKSLEQANYIRDAENYAIMATSGATISSFASKISQHIDQYNNQGIHPHRKVKTKEKQIRKQQIKKSPNLGYAKYDYEKSGIEFSNDKLVENALLDGMMNRKGKVSLPNNAQGRKIQKQKNSQSIDREILVQSHRVDQRQSSQHLLIAPKQKIATTNGWQIVQDPNFQMITTINKRQKSPSRKPPKQTNKKQQYGNDVHLVIM